jgi:nonsense-mediated mRNA decay protein 3
MFCVECGADGPTYQGLCAKCFPKKHAVVEPPGVLDIERCTSCGSYRFKSGWSRTDRDFALSRLLKETIPVRAPYQRVAFTHVAREEDANNLALTVKALGRFEDLETVRDFRVRVRIKPSLCETCQKQKGRYYEGILQVRGDGRELTPKEVRAARTLVAARIDQSGAADEFVSRVEEVHGGLDFYVSTNALGKSLAREIAETFGGSVGSSPKLFGQQQGREVYRVTSLVRLPAFQIGDVVRHKNGLAEVAALKPFVVLYDLATGESRRFKGKDVRSAKRVDSERLVARIERLESGELVAIHPETGESRPLARPTKPRTTELVVVWTRDAAFPSGLPANASKD